MANRRTWLALPLLLALSGWVRAEEPARYTVAGDAFGSPVSVTFVGVPKERADVIGAQVLQEFQRLHHKFHAWEPSALTELNDHIARGEPYQSDAEMVDLLKSAAALSARAENTFNPAIGHLIRAWGFQSSNITAHSPPPAEVKQWVAANPRMSDLVFDGTVIRSRNKAVMLDLGGYAKGYALDRAAAILRAQHVSAALINVGGNLLAIGQPGARPWRVGIQDPRTDGMVASLPLYDNEAIGTSGDYQRYFMQGGKRRAHIIDPRSGESVDTVASVTIIMRGGPDVGTRSDGYTKPLFLAGPGGWEAMAQRLGMQEVFLIDTRGGVHLTPAMSARLRSN